MAKKQCRLNDGGGFYETFFSIYFPQLDLGKGGFNMTMDLCKSEPILAATNSGALPHQICAGCRKSIHDRFLLRALDMYWHEDCLKCGCCDCRLGEVGSTLYTKSNLMLCKRDYLRLFGNTGLCAACNKVIPAFEMVMRARSNVYHLECFACQQCNHRFCVGDRFYLCENKILCEYDYEERLVFASIGNHPMLKRHAATNMSAVQTSSSPGSQQHQQHSGGTPTSGGAGNHHQHQSNNISPGSAAAAAAAAFNGKPLDDPNNNNNNNNNSTKSSNNHHHHGQLTTSSSRSLF